MNEIIACLAVLTLVAFLAGYTIGRAERSSARHDDPTEHGAPPL